ncbi:MAG: hypothetical protein JWM34_2622 [Ilumatobacteraceae bacterium]|nr:hypothetical protein [Ilumatobacteraceae bacterium]
MGSLRREIVIDATADEIWRVVGSPGLIHHWFPGIVDCTFDGTVRMVTTGTGIPMPEEIITNDRLLHRLQYRIDTPLFRSHLATFDAIDLDDGRCICIYSTDAVPDVMALVIGGATSGALEELQRQFNAGAGPALDAAAALAMDQSATKVAVH